MVALEQLVVGVDQQLELFVHKALAQFNRDGVVGHLCFAIGEDVVQAFDLRCLACDNDVVIALSVIGLQIRSDEVEILVETRLGEHVPIDHHAVRKRRSSVELHDVKGFNQGFKFFRADEECFRRGEFDGVRHPFECAFRALHGLLQLAFGALGVSHPNPGVGRNEIEERLHRFVEALVANVGHHHRTGHLVNAKLRDGIKLPD